MKFPPITHRDTAAIIHDGLHGHWNSRHCEHARGGPDASWLDRWLQTSRLEYVDRDDVDDLGKIVRSLDRGHLRRLSSAYGKYARMVLRDVADVPSPKVRGVMAPDGRGGVPAHESDEAGIRYQVALNSTASATGALPYPMRTAAANLPWLFSLAERWSGAGEPAGIGEAVEFRTDEFDAASIEALIGRLGRVLVAMTADSRRRS